MSLLHKSWDSWGKFYDEIIQTAQIIKESGIYDILRVANGGICLTPYFSSPITDEE